MRLRGDQGSFINNYPQIQANKLLRCHWIEHFERLSNLSNIFSAGIQTMIPAPHIGATNVHFHSQPILADAVSVQNLLQCLTCPSHTLIVSEVLKKVNVTLVDT